MKERGGAAGVEEDQVAEPKVALPVDVVRWKTPKDAVGKAWNTRNLDWRVGADVAAAACAGTLIAPIITVIDKGIIENATGKRPLKESMKASIGTMFKKPQKFFISKPFALLFALYTGTYLTANAIDTASSTVKSTPFASTTHGTAKFVATSTTNLSLCLYKDYHFTRMFSPGVSRPVGMPTYLLFTLRDCITIFASFNVPPILGPKLPMHLLPEGLRKVRSESVAQFIAPAAVQILSTPFHLLGLDFYNRSGSTSMLERWRVVKKSWAISCVARICRIVPAFGLGGVVNAGVRRNLMGKLE